MDTFQDLSRDKTLIKLLEPIKCDQQIRMISYRSNSVARWLVYLFNIWPFTTLKMSSRDFFAKLGFKFCQILDAHSKILPKSFKNCQSGKVLQNLVTLRSDQSFGKLITSIFNRNISFVGIWTHRLQWHFLTNIKKFDE